MHLCVFKTRNSQRDEYLARKHFMGVIAGVEEGIYRTSVASVCHYFNDVVKPLYMYECAYAAATAASGAPATDGIEEAYIYCLRSDNTEGVVCAAPTFATPFAHTLDTTDAPTTACDRAGES